MSRAPPVADEARRTSLSGRKNRGSALARWFFRAPQAVGRFSKRLPLVTLFLFSLHREKRPSETRSASDSEDNPPPGGAYFTIKLSPVISTGFSYPISAKSVGARSASLPERSFTSAPTAMRGTVSDGLFYVVRRTSKPPKAARSSSVSVKRKEEKSHKGEVLEKRPSPLTPTLGCGGNLF